MIGCQLFSPVLMSGLSATDRAGVEQRNSLSSIDLLMKFSPGMQVAITTA
jgi:hypothetical protein